jgi:hypothetical protein
MDRRRLHGAVQRKSARPQAPLELVAGDVHTSRDEIPNSVERFFRDHVATGGVFTVNPDGKKNHGKWFMFDALNFDALKKVAADNVCGAVPSGVGPALYIATGHPTRADRKKDNAAILIPASKNIRGAMKNFFVLLFTGYFVKSVFGIEGMFKNIYAPVEDDRFKLYLYPRSPFKDTVLGIFRNIKAGSAPSIRIVTPRWRSARKAIAQEIADLHAANNKASVEFAGRGPMHFSDVDEDDEEEPEMSTSVESKLKLGCVRYFEKPYDNEPSPPPGGEIPVNPNAQDSSIHSKYFQIDGLYVSGDGHAQQKLTWVGSPNCTGSAVDNSWEVLVKLRNEPGAFEAFRKNFEHLKTSSTNGPWPIEPPPA